MLISRLLRPSTRQNEFPTESARNRPGASNHLPLEEQN